MAESMTAYFKFEQKYRYFEGYCNSVESIAKDDGAFYCKTSIPLKHNKDDNPLWLNIRVFEPALAWEFSTKVKKGSYVSVWGHLKEVEDSEGRSFINFYVKGFQLLREPSKNET